MKSNLIIVFTIVLITISCQNKKNRLVGTWEFVSSDSTCGNQSTGRDCKDDIPEVAFLCCAERSFLYNSKFVFLDISQDSFINYSTYKKNSGELIVKKTGYYDISDKSINLTFFRSINGKIFSGDSLELQYQIEDDTLVLMYQDSTGIIKAIFAKTENIAVDTLKPKEKASPDPCESIIGVWVLEGEQRFDLIRLLEISAIENNLIWHEYYYNPKGKFKNNLNEEKGSIICENGTSLIDYVYNKQEIHIIKDGGSLLIGADTFNHYNK